MASKTYSYISGLPKSKHLWRRGLLLVIMGLWGSDMAAQEATEVVVQDSIESEVQKLKGKKTRFFYGMAVGGDLVGLVMKVAGSDWSLIEVMARINLKDKVFPAFEMGLGLADHEGRDQDYRFYVRAPYFRVGADYSFTKKHNGNRLFVGLRYGFSFFNYDLTSPTPLTDPVWEESRPFNHEGLNGSAHWGEVLFGLETKLWRFIRLGWDVRVKFRFTQSTDEIGPPWLIPGFGKNDTSGWGGTVKLMFEI